jgi:hypothetical protein
MASPAAARSAPSADGRTKVAALAGRRIDAAGAIPQRFPLGAINAVRDRIATLLRVEAVGTLVCSAACGADLIALEEAERLGLRRRIVLPFQTPLFRETSVIDRPGPWADAYDRIIAAAELSGDLITLAGEPEGAGSYERATREIIAEALRQTPLDHAPLAITVWDGAPRGPDDATESFRRQASENGFVGKLVLTV